MRGRERRRSDLEDWEVLDLLTSLVDKSLVIAETQGLGTRYRLLETVRQYGRERLLDQGAGTEVRGRHRDYFLAWAEEAEPNLRGVEQARWLEALETEHDNLRQALAFCLEEVEGVEAGLRLGAALGWFWYIRGHYGEGRAHLASALERAVGSEEQRLPRARALVGAGNLAYMQGDYVAARALYEESLTIRRELGEKSGIADGLDAFAELARQEQQERRAAQLWGAATALREGIGAPRSPGDQERFDQEVAEARSALGDAAFDATFAEGRAMTMEQAIELALNKPVPGSAG